MAFSFYFRRERLSALNISSENENDFLTDLEDHLTSPSSLYTGTGGKPPLTFVPADTKLNKKRLHLFYMCQISILMSYFVDQIFRTHLSLLNQYKT